MNVEIVAALVTAGAALGAVATSTWEARKRQRDDYLLSALDFLTGKTQRRSAGIAIAQGFHRKAKRLRPALVPHLVNQLLYLQTVQQEKNAATRLHEQDNVRRLADLLREIGDFNKYRPSYLALCEAVHHRQPGHGLPIPSNSPVADSLDQLYRALPSDFKAPDRSKIVWEQPRPLSREGSP